MEEAGAELLRLDNCKRLTASALSEQLNIGNVRALSLAFCSGMRAAELIPLAPSLNSLEVRASFSPLSLLAAVWQCKSATNLR